jgi:hypothetical protein
LWVRWGTFGFHKCGEFHDCLQRLLVSFSRKPLLHGVSKSVSNYEGPLLTEFCRFIPLFFLMFIQTDDCLLFLCFVAVFVLKWTDCPTRPFTLHHCDNSGPEQSICGTSACTTTQTQTSICNVTLDIHTLRLNPFWRCLKLRHCRLQEIR